MCIRQKKALLFSFNANRAVTSDISCLILYLHCLLFCVLYWSNFIAPLISPYVTAAMADDAGSHDYTVV